MLTHLYFSHVSDVLIGLFSGWVAVAVAVVMSKRKEEERTTRLLFAGICILNIQSGPRHVRLLLVSLLSCLCILGTLSPSDALINFVNLFWMHLVMLTQLKI